MRKSKGLYILMSVLLVASVSITVFAAISDTVGFYDSEKKAEYAESQRYVVLSGDTRHEEVNGLNISINGRILQAELADNSSAIALKELLAKGPVTVNMNDYVGMEKVGELGTSLPTNDERITTSAGDLILYQGDKFTIYYARNSWNLTRLGRINNINENDLRTLLGNGDVTVTLSLAE